MPCETARRGLADAAVLWALGLLAAFYAAVFGMMLSPRVDEDYRRTYVTREFGVYPPSRVFGGHNGLDHVPGTRLDLTLAEPRLHLNRFEWMWSPDRPGPNLRGLAGRIVLHVADGHRRPDRPHRLRLGVVCAYPADIEGRFRLTVNGTAVGGFSCAGRHGSSTVSADIPKGLIGSLRYDVITVERTAEGWVDRLATRFGARITGFSMPWMAVEPL